MYETDIISEQVNEVLDYHQYIQSQNNQLIRKGYDQIDKTIKEQIDVLFSKIFSIANEQNCRYITIKQYDILLDILCSWRRYFNQMHETITFPILPPLTSLNPTYIHRAIKQMTFVGKVIRISSNKTIKVEIIHLRAHPLYGKTIRNRKVLTVHDENNIARTDDIVLIAGCRRISKTKSHRLVRIISSPKENYIDSDDIDNLYNQCYPLHSEALLHEDSFTA